MITLLGSLLGFLTALVPEGFQIAKKRMDLKYKLEIIRLQASYGLQIEENKTDQEQYKHIYDFATQPGYKFVEATTCLVRPIITYAFFIVYGVIKLSLFFIDMSHSHDLLSSLAHIWNEEDYGIFAAIISFWFGHRAFRRHGRPVR